MSIIPKINAYLIIGALIGTLFSPFQIIHSVATTDVTWPDIELVEVANGLTMPVHITNAGDGSGRIFVVEQVGRIRIIKDQSLVATPFLDISGRVLTGGEQGLLSVAFPQNYADNGHFYVFYTNQSGDNQVSRFRITADPDVADPDSEELILYINHPNRENHNGGQLAFGPDGYLYISTGDGGGGGDPDENGQDTNTLLGKLLRIDVEFAYQTPSDATNRIFLPVVQDNGGPRDAYLIPADNPFVGIPVDLPEIWSLGLRNPWRFSFDRLTGDLYIGDVGQNKYEEINFQANASPGGQNYGWNIMEGLHCYPGDPCDQTGLTLPIAEYNHDLGCSVTGGFVYRGSQNPTMQGFYYYGDYCSGRIWALFNDNDIWVSEELINSPNMISSFGEDERGELYLTDRDSGLLVRLVESGSE